MLAVLEPAERRSLTTVARFRDAMPDTPAEDEALAQLLARATGIVESRCNRTFARERVAQTVTSRGPTLLLLERTLLVELHGVTRDGEELPADRYRLEAGMIRFRAEESFEELWRFLGGPALGDTRSRPRHYRVEYTGGYELPTDASEGTLPPELEHACHLIARSELDLSQRGDLGLSAERLGDASRTYAKGSAGLEAARAILERHARAIL